MIGRAVAMPLGLVDALTKLPSLLGGLNQRLEALSAPGGSLDRLADLSTALDRLADLDRSLNQLGELGQALDALAETTGRLPELQQHVEGVEAGVATIVEHLGLLQPTLEKLSGTVDTLGHAVEPLSRLAGRMPGGRKAARGEDEQPV